MQYGVSPPTWIDSSTAERSCELSAAILFNIVWSLVFYWKMPITKTLKKKCLTVQSLLCLHISWYREVQACFHLWGRLELGWLTLELPEDLQMVIRQFELWKWYASIGHVESSKKEIYDNQILRFKSHSEIQSYNLVNDSIILHTVW